MKNIRIFYPKIFIFLVVEFSVYLNRHVFVMTCIETPYTSPGKKKRVLVYIPKEKVLFMIDGTFAQSNQSLRFLKFIDLRNYSRTSMARTTMAHLPWMSRTRS